MFGDVAIYPIRSTVRPSDLTEGEPLRLQLAPDGCRVEAYRFRSQDKNRSRLLGYVSSAQALAQIRRGEAWGAVLSLNASGGVYACLL